MPSISPLIHHWEQTFDRSARGICVVAGDSGQIQTVNPAFAAMHGGAIGEFVGRPISTLRSAAPSAGAPGPARALEDGDLVPTEYEHRRLDGSVFPVSAETLTLRAPEGGLYRIAWFDDLTEQRAARTTSREATETLEIAFSRAPMGVALIGFDGCFLRVNASLCEMLGRTEDDLVGSTSRLFTHPDDLQLTAQSFAHLTTLGTPMSVQKRYLRPDGEVVWADTRGTAVAGADGRPSHIVSHFHDITAIKTAELERARATAGFETAFADAPIGMAIVGLDGRCLRANRVLCQLGGYTEDQLRRLSFREVTHPEDRDSDLEQVQQLLAGQIDRYAMQKRYCNVRGELIWTNLAVSLVRDPDGRPLHFIAQIEDISERKHLESELQHLADHDPLTELWNRRRFNEELERQVSRGRRYDEPAALLLLDLDGFKQVNDGYGHQVGDDLLKRISAALQAQLRLTDSLARLGGDEFAIILTNVSLAQALELATRLRRTIRRATISLADGREVGVTASVGVTALSADTSSLQDAFVHADQTMYRAKVRRPSSSRAFA